MNENRRTQPQLWKQFRWLGMLVLAVCLLWCNAARVKAEDIVIQCGDNCYGTLTDTGVLTISGTGKMWDWTEDTYYESEFYKHREDIFQVVIGDGITRIGGMAFGAPIEGYEYLRSVTIGKGVKEIGADAFSAASGLRSIDIPANVETIEIGAFYTSGLQEVTLHEGLKTIGQAAFYETSLKAVELPDGLDSVEKLAFYYTDQLDLVVPEHIRIIKKNAFEYVNATFKSKDVIIEDEAFHCSEAYVLYPNSYFKVPHGSTAEAYAKKFDVKFEYTDEEPETEPETEPVHSYNLHFNPCGGKVGTKDKTVQEGAKAGSLPTPTRTNYTFLGWYTARTGGTKYDSSTVMPAKNITLYAHWEKLSVGRCSRPTVTNVKTRKAIIKIKPVKDAKGYEYAWSLRKDMKKAKTKTIHGTKLTISRLTKNKTYYVRVRAYRNGANGKKIYGKWSDIRTIKIKK